jgi:hypothetical protein
VSAHLGERLSALLDGELPESELAEAHVHLRECAACAKALEELAAVDALAREVPVEAPPGYFDALPGRIRTRLRERRKPRVAPAAVWAAAAAAVVMVAVVAPRALREAAPPALREAASPMPAATVPAATDLLSKTKTRSEAEAEVDNVGAPAFVANRERLARAVPPLRTSVPAAADAKKLVTRDDTRAGAAQGKVSEPPAAPAPAEAASGFSVAPAAPAPQAAAAPSLRGGVAAMQEQKAEDTASRDAGVSGRTMADARKEQAQGRRLRADERYEVLALRRSATAAEARDLARAWEVFARDLPGDRHADEAKVRAVESLVVAWRMGHAPDDLERARAAARSYLDASGARQAERVRALLESLPPSP